MLKDVVQNTVAFDCMYEICNRMMTIENCLVMSSWVGGGLENAKVCLELGVDEVLSTFIVAPPDATFVHI